MSKKIVYIAHCISGDIENNLKDIIRILRIININTHPYKDNIKLEGEFSEWNDKFNFDFSDIIPLAPYYADILALDDNNALERKRGIENYIDIIKTGVFDELWLTGDKISLGMQEEIKLFRLLGKPIVDYTNKI